MGSVDAASLTKNSSYKDRYPSRSPAFQLSYAAARAACGVAIVPSSCSRGPAFPASVPAMLFTRVRHRSRGRITRYPSASAGPCPPTSRAAARDPPVVSRDLVSGLLGRERFGELVGAVLHRRVERMVEPHAEEPALGGRDRAGVRRGALEQALGGFGEEAGLGDDVGDAVRRQLVEPVNITGQHHLACL